MLDGLPARALIRQQGWAVKSAEAPSGSLLQGAAGIMGRDAPTTKRRYFCLVGTYLAYADAPEALILPLDSLTGSFSSASSLSPAASFIRSFGARASSPRAASARHGAETSGSASPRPGISPGVSPQRSPPSPALPLPPTVASPLQSHPLHGPGFEKTDAKSPSPRGSIVRDPKDSEKDKDKDKDTKTALEGIDWNAAYDVWDVQSAECEPRDDPPNSIVVRNVTHLKAAKDKHYILTFASALEMTSWLQALWWASAAVPIYRWGIQKDTQLPEKVSASRHVHLCTVSKDRTLYALAKRQRWDVHRHDVPTARPAKVWLWARLPAWNGKALTNPGAAEWCVFRHLAHDPVLGVVGGDPTQPKVTLGSELKTVTRKKSEPLPDVTSPHEHSLSGSQHGSSSRRLSLTLTGRESSSSAPPSPVREDAPPSGVPSPAQPALETVTVEEEHVVQTARVLGSRTVAPLQFCLQSVEHFDGTGALAQRLGASARCLCVFDKAATQEEMAALADAGDGDAWLAARPPVRGLITCSPAGAGGPAEIVVTPCSGDTWETCAERHLLDGTLVVAVPDMADGASASVATGAATPATTGRSSGAGGGSALLRRPSMMQRTMSTINRSRHVHHDTLSVVVIGCSGVGKSALVRSACQAGPKLSDGAGGDDDDEVEGQGSRFAGLGVAHSATTFGFGQHRWAVEFTDIRGTAQAELVRSHARTADAILGVFDATDGFSLEWLEGLIPGLKLPATSVHLVGLNGAHPRRVIGDARLGLVTFAATKRVVDQVLPKDQPAHGRTASVMSDDTAGLGALGGGFGGLGGLSTEEERPLPPALATSLRRVMRDVLRVALEGVVAARVMTYFGWSSSEVAETFAVWRTAPRPSRGQPWSIEDAASVLDALGIPAPLQLGAARELAWVAAEKIVSEAPGVPRTPAPRGISGRLASPREALRRIGSSFSPRSASPAAKGRGARPVLEVTLLDTVFYLSVLISLGDLRCALVRQALRQRIVGGDSAAASLGSRLYGVLVPAAAEGQRITGPRVLTPPVVQQLFAACGLDLSTGAAQSVHKAMDVRMDGFVDGMNFGTWWTSPGTFFAEAATTRVAFPFLALAAVLLRARAVTAPDNFVSAVRRSVEIARGPTESARGASDAMTPGRQGGSLGQPPASTTTTDERGKEGKEEGKESTRACNRCAAVFALFRPRTVCHLCRKSYCGSCATEERHFPGTGSTGAATTVKAKVCVDCAARLDARNAVVGQTPLQPRVTKWAADTTANECQLCAVAFTFVRRRHHCRQCGSVVCSECSPRTATVEGYDKPQRVCVVCEVQQTRSRRHSQAPEAGDGTPRPHRGSHPGDDDDWRGVEGVNDDAWGTASMAGSPRPSHDSFSENAAETLEDVLAPWAHIAEDVVHELPWYIDLDPAALASLVQQPLPPRRPEAPRAEYVVLVPGWDEADAAVEAGVKDDPELEPLFTA